MLKKIIEQIELSGRKPVSLKKDGYATALRISAAGVASVAEAIPVPRTGHANLVQFGYAPREPSALPVEPIDQGAFHIPLEPSTP